MMSADYHSYDELTLLRLLSEGDDKAFTEIYDRYWEKLLFVAGVKCRHLGIAEEIVQDIFLHLWIRRKTLNITGTLESYLAVSVKYRVINVQAKMKRARDYQQYAEKMISLRDNLTEEQLRFEELKERLEKFVSSLPEKCRLTYRLSREEGLSQKEIASILQISEKGVEANLARALKSLRVNLKHYLSVFFISIF
jgi:RNA polymerase sigma-70 factor (family 1)